MAEDMGEKTEQPTAKRKQDARSEGQTAKSTDLSSAILLIGGSVLLAVFGLGLMRELFAVMRQMLAAPGLTLDDLWGESTAAPYQIAMRILLVLTPMMICLALLAYLSSVLQVGLLFSTKVLNPNLNKLDPVKGVQRLFSLKSLVKAGMDILKFVALVTVMMIVIHRHEDTIYGLSLMGLMQGLATLTRITLEVVVIGLLLLLLLGLLDFSYQKWQTNKDLKMTKHQVKDERKSAEGDMAMKRERFKMAREMLSQRIGQDVPRADVVVTNPTHYSVAIRYDPEGMDAPQVTAKGADYVAMKIRQIAVAHGVPIVERAPLARALYASVPVGGEVHPAHYEAVAEVLAYVYRLEGKTAAAV